ncbi:GNAT family N-acetyltransferase [Ewingella americana]|jgi:GNAT superfamily N-acetyltransferase|uniref:GNAT family N-acetyltransferase n=1 Tax=Ewingella americana TaxID=41202 RepID=A0A502GTV1_9GAMM|nr:GNAT family N-acetyltransferase [Ewingella americana]TPG65095.1 GNAT family N-acetyltransferase [Ewingella americana]
MVVRLASPQEAEKLWIIRNKAIRHGCKDSYGEETLQAWTQDKMPEGFRNTIAENPFFVIDDPAGEYPVATGFLDLKNQSVEAIFTLPEFTGQGMARAILDAIKNEARLRGLKKLVLSSTPNAFEFYKKNGFILLKESIHHSPMANADLRCMEMSCDL